MFGWEFPPVQSGGLGVACQGIVDGLISNGHVVNLVLPKTHPKMQMFNPGQFNLLAAHESGGIVNVSSITSSIYSPYASAASYKTWLKETIEERKGEGFDEIYGKDIFQEVHRFAMQACLHATKTPHDVVHTHDWLTAEAGIQAKKLSDQPHVMHVHATEFDRSGENPNQQVYDMERRGMEHADRVIAVSQYTKNLLMKHYGIADHKIDVVHNAIQPSLTKYQKTHYIDKKDKVVLFLGRMTMQKGPDYFLHMAFWIICQMLSL
jgi:glycosyltransferase involved in cell wall biosynthesis